MSVITWDEEGARVYEHGDKQLVLYKRTVKTPASGDTPAEYYWRGYAWNGLTAFTESPEGAEESAFYADDIKYASLRSNEEYGCTIECYTYPDEFKDCIGEKTVTGADAISVHQQSHSQFRLSAVTTVGNDTEADDYGYKYHFVYGCTAGVSERSHTTINDSPELETMSFEIKATKQNIPVDGTVYKSPDFKPTAKVTVDMSKLDNTTTKTVSGATSAVTLREYVDAAIRDKIYGTTSTEAELPDIDDILSLIKTAITTFNSAT